MAWGIRVVALALSLLLWPAGAVAVDDGQGRGVRRPPPQRQTVVVRGQVFIGGYFYDPRFGPYPWWPPGAYPHWYFPVYDHRGDLRIAATPQEASVYVDGFYAGIVDDVDGIFQSLPLPPGGHTITLYLDGFRTVTHRLYLQPGSTFTLREALTPLGPGERSEPPILAPAVPRPPAGTYREPHTPPRAPWPAPAPADPAVTTQGFGTLELRVQPATAEVTIDGARWATSKPGHFVVQVSTGRHRVEVSRPGYRGFSTEIDVREGETTPLNVSLPPETT